MSEVVQCVAGLNFHHTKRNAIKYISTSELRVLTCRIDKTFVF